MRNRTVDGALELARAETTALLEAARRVVRHLQDAEVALDREAWALAMLEADLHGTALAGEIEETRRLACRCGIDIEARALSEDVAGDDDEDSDELEDEDDELEDDELIEEDEELEEDPEEDPEEGFDTPERIEVLNCRRG